MRYDESKINSIFSFLYNNKVKNLSNFTQALAIEGKTFVGFQR
jgi:hypothetical protein